MPSFEGSIYTLAEMALAILQWFEIGISLPSVMCKVWFYSKVRKNNKKCEKFIGCIRKFISEKP